mmetsp:Transcript_71109/g.153275  ORF Transcript_71109/g.153275 Transcript_71109/m.153275 type:complete len:539 (-) Transcript_71109:13-1629(-)
MGITPLRTQNMFVLLAGPGVRQCVAGSLPISISRLNFFFLFRAHAATGLLCLFPPSFSSLFVPQRVRRYLLLSSTAPSVRIPLLSPAPVWSRGPSLKCGRKEDLRDESLPVLRLIQVVHVGVDLRIHGLPGVRIPQHRPHDVPSEGGLRHVHHVGQQAPADGLRVVPGGHRNGPLRDVAGVALLGALGKGRVREGLPGGGRPQRLADAALLLRGAALEDGLRDVVPEGVAAELLAVGQDMVHDGQGRLVGAAVLDEPAEDPAAEAVIRDRGGVAAGGELLGDEARGGRRHDLDDLLEHVVCVGRVDGVLDLAAELGADGSGLVAARGRQGCLHRAAADRVPREAPDGAPHRLDCPGVARLQDVEDALRLLRLRALGALGGVLAVGGGGLRQSVGGGALLRARGGARSSLGPEGDPLAGALAALAPRRAGADARTAGSLLEGWCRAGAGVEHQPSTALARARRLNNLDQADEGGALLRVLRVAAGAGDGLRPDHRHHRHQHHLAIARVLVVGEDIALPAGARHGAGHVQVRRLRSREWE